MVWQRAGTVAVQNGSTTVIGTNVDFAASSRNGDSFVGPDGATYELANVASSTVISILPAYKGPTVSGAAYAIMPVQGYDKMLSDAFNNLNNQFGPKLAALGSTGNYDTLPVSKGGTGGTAAADARTNLGVVAVASSTDSTPGRYVTVGYGGIGFLDNAPYTGNGLNPDNYRTSLHSMWGQFTISGFGLKVGFLTVRIGTAGYGQQEFSGDGSGVVYTRDQVNSQAWSQWVAQYNSASALVDPQTGGGLMSSAVIGGFNVSKYANGQIHIYGAGARTAVISSGAQVIVDIQLPVSLVSGAAPTASTVPNAVYDYRVTGVWMPSVSLVRLAIINGPTAQFFDSSVSVWGRWKI